MNDLAEWTPKRFHAAELTALGFPGAKVAKEVKIAERTIWYWRKEEDFQQVVAEMRESRRARIRDKLDKATEAATDVIDRVEAGDKGITDSQLAVAKWLLEGQGLLSPGDRGSLTLTQSVTGSVPELVNLARALAADRDAAGASGVVFPGELAAAHPAEDPASDAGLHPIRPESVPTTRAL